MTTTESQITSGKAENVDLWQLVDAYADAREEYQRSTERRLLKQQRENLEGAKSALAAAIEAVREKDRGESYAAGQKATAGPVLTEAFERAENAEGMAESMRMFRKDMIEAGIIGESVPPMFMTEAILGALRKLDAERDHFKAIAERQAADLSTLQTYGWDCGGMDHYGDYVLFSDVQKLLSPAQQEPNPQTVIDWLAAHWRQYSNLNALYADLRDAFPRPVDAQRESAKDCTEPDRADCPRKCIEFCNKAEQEAAIATDAHMTPEDLELLKDLADLLCPEAAQIILKAHRELNWRGVSDCEAHVVISAPHCPICLVQERDTWKDAYENMRAFAESKGLDTTTYGAKEQSNG